MKKSKSIIITLALIAAICSFIYIYIEYLAERTVKYSAVSPTFTHYRDTIPRTDTTTQNILLIGDSMAYSLMFRVQNYCNYNHHNLNVVTWVSATTETYANCDTLEYFVNLYNPTYILFVIGANEMFVSNAAERIENVNKIIPQTHGIRTIWIGPPNWKEDTGINDMLMRKFGPRQFFLSKNLKFTRIKGDVAHPDRPAGTMWMDSIASWIKNKSFFPIRLEKPEEENPIHVDFVKLVVKEN
ncbi:MAG: hypothetical protein J6Z01_04655 [Bacteroidales bacterium]|nr:hypothetical protein [Bacteroidales bacterium]